MNLFEFIAALVSALAWPLTIVAILLILKRHIPALIATLKKVKVSGFELELERTRAEVEVSLGGGGTKTSGTQGLEPPVRESAAGPIGTVIEQFTRVEAEIRNQLEKADVSYPDNKSALSLLQLGIDKGVFTPAIADTVRGIAVLRNLAAHGRADELSPKSVAEYESLVDATVYALAHQKGSV